MNDSGPREANAYWQGPLIHAKHKVIFNSYTLKKRTKITKFKKSNIKIHTNTHTHKIWLHIGHI